MGSIDPRRGFNVSLIQHCSYINTEGQEIFLPELDEAIIAVKHVHSGAIGPLIEKMLEDRRYDPKIMSFDIFEEVHDGLH